MRTLLILIVGVLLFSCEKDAVIPEVDYATVVIHEHPDHHDLEMYATCELLDGGCLDDLDLWYWHDIEADSVVRYPKTLTNGRTWRVRAIDSTGSILHESILTLYAGQTYHVFNP